MVILKAEMSYDHIKPRECKINGEVPKEIKINLSGQEVAKVKKGDLVEVTKERANEILNRADGLVIASIVSIGKEQEVETADKKVANLEKAIEKPKRTTKKVPRK